VVAESTPEDHEFLEREEWEAWNSLMMLHRWVFQRLDHELRRSEGLAVTEFDVLITLYNAPDRRLRMSALAERVLLSPAGATHLVTRLERDRMVRREVDPADGRKWFAVLTDEGDATLRSARRTTTRCDKHCSLSRHQPSAALSDASGDASRSGSHIHWHRSSRTHSKDICGRRLRALGYLGKQSGHPPRIGQERRMTSWPFHGRAAAFGQDPLQHWMIGHL